MTTTNLPADDNPVSSNAFSADPPNWVELDRHGADLVDSLAQARAAIKAWGNIEDEVKGKLAALIGDAKYGRVLGVNRVSVSRYVPNRFDQKAFKADHPQLHHEYVRPGNPVTTVLLTNE